MSGPQRQWVSYCPFCGSEPTWIHHSNYFDGERQMSIGCCDFRALGREAELIDKWNRRAALQPTEQPEAAQDCCRHGMEMTQLCDECDECDAAQAPQNGTPIAWVRRHPDGSLTAEFLEDAVIEPARKKSGAWLPLCLQRAPQKRAAVTDEQIEDTARAIYGSQATEQERRFARALLGLSAQSSEKG